jgi:hypothetical protein
MRAREVITKLAEDAYFIRVDNRVTQVPPLRTREADHEATSRNPADNRRNRTRGELPQNPTALGHQLVDPLRAVTALVALAAVAPWWLMTTPAAEAAAAGAPHMGLEGEPVAEAITEAKVTRVVLTDKRRIPLRSASVRTHTFFTTGFPRFLSIRRARGLQAFDLTLHSSYSNPNYNYTRKQLSYTRENDKQSR